uniref:DUF659 domain-containing protein n=1 Tax=Lactuca sativa TaxID=4236 RepID=A0A9R1UNZ5_LACSA|nr:hypothetical protein LSAT_V11C800453130 [Lactuca sativa]
MEGHSSHASMNPNTTTTPTNTISDVGTISTNRDMAWERGVQKDPLKKANIWCTLCHKRVCGGITRLKEQLTHTGGNVAACTKVTTEITKKVLELMSEKIRNKKERKRTTRILRSTSCIDLSENEDEEDDIVQNNLIKEKFKKVAWKKIVVWAYSVWLPFNVVCDEGFQDVINASGEYGRCNQLLTFLYLRIRLIIQMLRMPAPSNHNMWVTLLKDVLEDTYKFNVNEVIAEVGEENIVQFITDNGLNHKVAGKIFEEQHPKLFWTRCVAYCVNLTLQDIGKKEAAITTNLTEARVVLVYIDNHRRILNKMRNLIKNKELHTSCVTRFSTQFYTLQSVHENRNC